MSSYISVGNTDRHRFPLFANLSATFRDWVAGQVNVQWIARLAKVHWLNRSLTLMIFKTIILAVSAYDLYLTVKYLEFLPQMEENLICRWLLGIDQGGSVSLQRAAAFITAKFTGNVLVMGILEVLAIVRFRYVGFIACVVAAVQMVLAQYLMFGTASQWR